MIFVASVVRDVHRISGTEGNGVELALSGRHFNIKTGRNADYSYNQVALSAGVHRLITHDIKDGNRVRTISQVMKEHAASWGALRYCFLNGAVGQWWLQYPTR